MEGPAKPPLEVLVAFLLYCEVAQLIGLSFQPDRGQGLEPKLRLL